MLASFHSASMFSAGYLNVGRLKLRREKVITRIFRVKVPTALHVEFEAMFLSVSVPYVQTAQGIVSVALGRPTKWAPDEYVMISVWANEDALRSFAGENWNLAVIPGGMEKYVSECWIHHYENFS